MTIGIKDMHRVRGSILVVEQHERVINIGIIIL